MQTSLGRFRLVAMLEGISYLLFGLTVPLKYWYSMPEPNFYVGMAHGLLFLLYCFLLIMAAVEHRWSFLKMVLAFVASLLPFGTFIADKRLFNDKPGL